MPNAFARRLRRLPSDKRAATAVEFALLVTPLVFLILASLQISIVFFADQVLQSAATAAGRQLMTGSVQNAGDTKSQFANVVCADAPILFNCGSLMIDVQSASSYSNVSTSPLTPSYDGNGNVTNNWNYSPGGPGDIVIMRVMYDWPIVAGQLLPGLADQSNGSRLLVATTVFKNEPYK